MYKTKCKELSKERKESLKKDLVNLFYNHGIIIDGYDIELYAFKHFEHLEAFKEYAEIAADHLIEGSYYDAE